LSPGQITELLRSAEAELVPLIYGSPRYARVVELRFFAASTEDDVAGTPGVSLETARHDWRFADTWLDCGIGKHK
jgi:hypothetical protein